MTTAVPAVRNAVRTWLEKFEAGDTVLVAVSGGADSLALAYALSVEADKLASEYNYHYYHQARCCSLISGNTVQVHSAHGTLTSKIRQHIRLMATKQTIQQHIKIKQQWDDTTFHLVDWDTHGISIRKEHHRKHFFIKFIHDLLPL